MAIGRVLSCFWSWPAFFCHISHSYFRKKVTLAVSRKRIKTPEIQSLWNADRALSVVSITRPSRIIVRVHGRTTRLPPPFPRQEGTARFPLSRMGRPGRECWLWGKVHITIVVAVVEEGSTVFSSISNGFPTGAFVHMASRSRFGRQRRCFFFSSVRSTITKRNFATKKRHVQWRTI
jgi:hypothetical protein